MKLPTEVMKLPIEVMKLPSEVMKVQAGLMRLKNRGLFVVHRGLIFAGRCMPATFFSALLRPKLFHQLAMQPQHPDNEMSVAPNIPV